MKSLVISAESANLESLRGFVTAAANEAGLGEERRFRLVLAVDEIASNIITHGTRCVSEKTSISVHAETRHDRLRVIMEDGGVPFDPRHYDLPGDAELAGSLEERVAGGLGIYFALTGVDNFYYESDGTKNHSIFEVML